VIREDDSPEEKIQKEEYYRMLEDRVMELNTKKENKHKLTNNKFLIEQVAQKVSKTRPLLQYLTYALQLGV
jgi:hypothetical protein